MARRLLYTLVIAGLGAAAFFLAQPQEPEDLGLVVHVHVRDAADKPLKNAQAERLFDPGWRVVNGDGYRRLTHVRLKADQEKPTAEAVAEAVRVRAPFYTLRRGFEPQVTQRADGAWDARYTLHHHGVLRVHVQGTHLGPVKAYLEPDAKKRWEAMDQGNVARPGAPAAFRIYPGMEEVVVRMIGEPDKDGVIAVATRRHSIKPPGTGHIVEKHLVPDAVTPIVVNVLCDEPRPPTLAGIVTVTELAPGGRRIAHGPASIDDEGMCVVRGVGAGRYELRALPHFLHPSKPVVVDGGASADVRCRPRPWAVLEHPDVDLREFASVVAVRAKDGGSKRRPRGWLPGLATSRIPLPDTGSWNVRIALPGSDATPPVLLAADVVAEAAGPHERPLVGTTEPHGTLTVRTAPEAWTRARGATVTLGRRTKTLLKGLAQEATFKHVRAGTVRVRLEWNDAEAAIRGAEIEVKDGETAEVTLDYEAKK